MAKKKKSKYFDIVKGEKPTLVDFYATWCGPCKMMNPVLQDLANDLDGAARILKVDIDKNKKLAHKLEVQSVPTLMVYKEGKVMWRKSGAQTKAKLMKAIRPHF